MRHTLPFRESAIVYQNVYGRPPCASCPCAELLEGNARSHEIAKDLSRSVSVMESKAHAMGLTAAAWGFFTPVAAHYRSSRPAGSQLFVQGLDSRWLSDRSERNR